MLDDRHGDLVGVGRGLQLEQEALASRSGSHAGRIEGLDDTEHPAHLGGVRVARPRDVVEIGAQVAVVVEVADDRPADADDVRVAGGQPQLLVEMIAQ